MRKVLERTVREKKNSVARDHLTIALMYEYCRDRVRRGPSIGAGGARALPQALGGDWGALEGGALPLGCLLIIFYFLFKITKKLQNF